MTATTNRIEQALESFASHPSTVATYQSIQATQEGFALIYRMERDQQFGRSVAGFFYDIARLIFWPLLALAINGLMIAVSYLFPRKFCDVVINGCTWMLGWFKRESNAQKIEQLVADKNADYYPEGEDFEKLEVM